MKKLLCMMLSVIILLTCAEVTAFASNDGDMTAPVIRSLKIENADALEFDRGDHGAMVIVDIVEDGIGVDDLELVFKDSKGRGVSIEAVDLGYEALFTGKHKIEMLITGEESFQSGVTYTLDSIWISDRMGNYRHYNSESPSSWWKKITRKITVKKCLRPDRVVKSKDKTPPVLNSIRIHNADDLDTSKKIWADIKVTEKESGLSSIELRYRNVENFEDIRIGLHNRDELRTGYHTVHFGVNRLKPGKYELESVSIMDYAGNDADYNENYPNWNKLAHTINVTKVVKAPKIKSMRIVKKDVVSPDFLKMELDVQQGSSKLKEVHLELKNRDSGLTMYLSGDMESKSGKQIVKFPIEMFCWTGQWEMVNMSIWTKDNVGFPYFKEGEYEPYDWTELYLSDIPGYKEQKIYIHNLYDPVYFGSLQNKKKALKEIEKMKSGEAVILDCRYEHKAPKELFEAIAGKDKTLIFQDENVQWIFRGKKIKKSRCKDIWLQTMVNIRSGKSVGFPNEKKVVEIKFEDNGLLPGEAIIRINHEYLQKKYIRDDDELVLSYYDDGELDVLDTNVALAADGYAEIKIKHNSTYIISQTIPRLVAPRSVKAAASGCTVKLSWGRVTGADGYKIYRSVSEKGSYQKIATVKGRKSTSYTDHTVKPDQKYYYRVRAYSTRKNVKAAYSKGIWIKTGKGQVKNIHLSRADGSYVRVIWKKVPGVTGYKIYSSKTQNGTYKLVKTTQTSSVKLEGIKKNDYVKIRFYKKIGKKVYYGKYSNPVKYSQK